MDPDGENDEAYRGSLYRCSALERPSLAQSVTALSDTELSKESENPVSRIITLPLRYEAEFNDGAYDATKDT
jgi:hypothetical protein